MTREELLTNIKAQLMLCAGWDSDEIAAERKKALDYFFMRARGDEVTGKSDVVSGDVSAMVEATLAQILAAFTTDNIAEFDPNDAEDEDQAQLETDVVTRLVMSDCNGFLEIGTAIKDALLLRNGLVKVWVEETQIVRTREFVNVRPEAVPTIVQSIPGAECEVKRFDPKTGELEIRCLYRNRKFRSRALPNENFLYKKTQDCLDLQDTEFCAERHIEARSDLVGRGFSKAAVARLKRYTTENKPDAAARRPRQLAVEPFKALDESQERVEWFECHVLIDRDGDGVSERRRISVDRACTEILEDVPASLVPVAAGVVFVNPHEFTGISQYDKLKQTQDINTGLTRALLDNVEACNRHRVAYLDGKVNTDDLANPRVNGEIRVRSTVGDVNRAMMAFAVPDLSAGILANLEHQRNVRAELGGASLELATGQAQMSDRVGSQGLDRAYSVMEQLAALMTQNMAATLLRSVFLLAHATLRENFAEPIPIKMRGNWYAPIPAQWPERRRVTIKVGMSPGERARKKAAYEFILNSQLTLAERGMDGVLVNVDGFYKTLMDWARVCDVQNPEQYFVAPASPEAQQAMQQKNATGAAMQKMQTDLMTQAVSLEQMRIALEKYAGDADRQFKYYDAILKSEIEEAKIVGGVTADLMAAQRSKTNGGANANAGRPKQLASVD